MKSRNYSDVKLNNEAIATLNVGLRYRALRDKLTQPTELILEELCVTSVN